MKEKLLSEIKDVHYVMRTIHDECQKKGIICKIEGEKEAGV